MKYRWTEAGKGQVRERNEKTLEGGKTTEREELTSDMRHTRAQFQSKAGNTTTGTGIMTTGRQTALIHKLGISFSDV